MAPSDTSQSTVDNRLAVETPEAVEFELDLAGILPRGGAWGVDLMIKAAVLWAVTLVAIFLGDLATPVVLLLLFGLNWLYHPLFEVWLDGQTPGKKVFNIRVVNRDGTPIGWYGAIIRNLVRVVDFLPFGYATAVVAMVTSGSFQRLGDLAGDTVVTHHRGAYATRDIAELPDAEPIAVPAVLSPLEQEAIIDFAERSGQFGSDRSAELAEILAELVDAQHPQHARQRVFGLARRIVRWG